MIDTYFKFIVAYFLVQRLLLYKVCSSPVRISQLPERQTAEDQALADLMDDSAFKGASSNTSSTALEPQKEQGITNITDNHPFFSRVSRSLHPCEKKRIRKWNHCLDRFFTEVHCKKLSVVCYSPDNIPPKCKKNYEVVFGPNGSCIIASSCTCAA